MSGSPETSRPFAMWLTPTSTDRRWLSKVIQDFAVEHHTPAFEPHVTLYSGVLSPGDSLEDIVRSALSQERPLTLQVAGLDCTDDYFRSGFIAFETCQRLIQLQQKLYTQLENPSDYDLKPHLSLFYIDSPIEQKWMELRRIVFSVKQVTMDALKIVSPSTGNWLDLDQWQVLQTYHLAQD